MRPWWISGVRPRAVAAARNACELSGPAAAEAGVRAEHREVGHGH